MGVSRKTQVRKNPQCLTTSCLRHGPGQGVSSKNLGDLYVENKTSRYARAARVPLEPLLEESLREIPGLTPERVVVGYYYWNLRARRGDCQVTFETSDYTVMKARHRSDVVYKLILHADGTLGGDWDPRKQILLSPETIPLIRRQRLGCG